VFYIDLQSIRADALSKLIGDASLKMITATRSVTRSFSIGIITSDRVTRYSDTSIKQSPFPKCAASAQYLINISEKEKFEASQNEITRAKAFSLLFISRPTPFAGGIFSASELWCTGIRCTSSATRASARDRCINLIRGSRFSRSLEQPRGVSYARTPRSLVASRLVYLPSVPSRIIYGRGRDDERARHFIKKQADDSATVVDPHCLRAPAV